MMQLRISVCPSLTNISSSSYHLDLIYFTCFITELHRKQNVFISDTGTTLPCTFLSLSKIPILFTMSQGKSSPMELVKKFNNWVENYLDWIFIGGGN